MRLPHRFVASLIAFLSLVLSMIAQPEVVSPEIRPDHHVTLRVHAPDAHSVALQGVDFKSPQPMTKGSGGVWSITIGPLKPDIYSYTFLVDSATVLDPLNRNVKKWLHSENMFEIPGTPPTLSEAQPVPHGVLHRHPFFSRTRQAQAAFQVYTPPGFDPRAATQYPVVYLLHGFGDDETAWAENGRANFVADNLLAAGRTVPAIIVMPNGHPVPIPTGARFEDYSPANLAAMEHELLTEVMPLVESLYPIRRDAASRAIVGLSMGGGHALNVGLTHLDTFSWIGGFSSAAPAGKLDEKFDGLLKSTNSGSGGPRLLWIAIGKDDFLMDQNKTFVAWLDAHHVRHTWQVSDGGHEWRNWRQYLGEFLPLLFR